MITLEKVNKHNFKKIIDMKLPPDQACFVASNVVSLAQAWLYYEEARPFAICEGKEVVGFVMLDWDEGERTVGIWRFMIGSQYQQKGYGKKALEIIIKLVREEGKFDLIYLDYVSNNTIARELYHSLGFMENGEVEDDEIVMTLPLTNEPKVGMVTADQEDIDDFLKLIENEKKEGTSIPKEFQDEDFIRKAVEDSKVKRFTIMGETIGLAMEDTLLINKESQSFLYEAQLKLKGRK